MYWCISLKKCVSIVLVSIVFLFSSIGVYAITTSNEDTTIEDKGIFLPIVMYHSIVDDVSKEGGYIVTPQIVEEDLRYLSTHGYKTVTVNDLIDYIQYDKPLPEKPVMITADDGFYNNYCYLVPLLQKYKYSAIISFVGQYTDYTAVNDPHVPEYSYCTWEDINTIVDTNVIELGNHTYDMHSNSERNGCAKLSYETEEQYKQVLTSDIGKLQREFSTNTGITPIVFAYPFGYISRESVPILKSLGFKATLTCYEMPNYITKDMDCLFGLNRYNRNSTYSTQEYMKKLLGEYYET